MDATMEMKTQLMGQTVPMTNLMNSKFSIQTTEVDANGVATFQAHVDDLNMRMQFMGQTREIPRPDMAVQETMTFQISPKGEFISDTVGSQ